MQNQTQYRKTILYMKLKKIGNGIFKHIANYLLIIYWCSSQNLQTACAGRGLYMENSLLMINALAITIYDITIDC